MTEPKTTADPGQSALAAAFAILVQELDRDELIDAGVIVARLRSSAVLNSPLVEQAMGEIANAIEGGRSAGLDSERARPVLSIVTREGD